MIIGPCLFSLAVLILIELRHQLRVIARLRRSNTLAVEFWSADGLGSGQEWNADESAAG